MDSAVVCNIASNLDDRDVLSMSVIEKFRDPLKPGLDRIWAYLRADASDAWKHLTFGASAAPAVSRAVYSVISNFGIHDGGDTGLVYDALPEDVKAGIDFGGFDVRHDQKKGVVTVVYAYAINGRYDLFINHEFDAFHEEHHFAQIGGNGVFLLEDSRELPWSGDVRRMATEPRFAAFFALMYLALMRSKNQPADPDHYDFSHDAEEPDRALWARFAAARFEQDPFV